ncbi:tripeptide aminopeptidase [Parabacteroides sp. PF5-5]|uniref:peptidase T n=1 Tax=unclassified Parabacteroides TaxID=2649774 RepID=UPI002476488E|nr:MULTISPECIES: peptidase T [unclassified Parabacteroides]MDH6306578.1 tripeptide aminopeptidase [Parabacteroides sp. PH5-39]MDH6317545.1 tripeptide aminopeptidase [Parabacteroides sp. PF5-13]MDH6321289.1 tripeptide aminopeptidase [Parabacteroides sp. PH5-13]MDH6325021.1 tripeptide aminopeptidase [Parabacteroides sp. PH5-8]MDH6328730.1 tripeptide aminopeptidase [Parabacteroides sp. PH5-41]
MKIVDRFLKYVSYDTQSSETSGKTPSTPGQRVLAEEIAKELKEIGLEDITLDDNCYLMATLPANTSKKVPVIGFIAHLDTSPDMSGKDAKPRIVAYKGGDIVLSEKQGVVLSPSMFPELNDYVNQDIIVTDGTTLLGADDKGGIAAIISAMQYLIEHPEIEHGKIRIAFTPDEEIGQGADHFDVKQFGCEWGYTIDGGQIGELEYENFNAAAAKVTFKGLNVHPGTAKGKMVNASLLATEFASWLPVIKRPEHTEGYEGFFHLTNMSGTVEEASLSYIVRDHDRKLFEQKKEMLQSLTNLMNERYPGSTQLEVRDQYYNMREIVEPQKHIIDLAYKAMEAVGVKPIVKPIRGGTDGSRLSFMGLPCPNIFAGGLNFHGRYEFLPVKSLEKSMETIIKITELLTKQS